MKWLILILLLPGCTAHQGRNLQLYGTLWPDRHDAEIGLTGAKMQSAVQTMSDR